MAVIGYRKKVKVLLNRGKDTGIGTAVQNLLHFDVPVPGDPRSGGSKEVYQNNITLLVRTVLFSSPANVQLLHELFESVRKSTTFCLLYFSTFIVLGIQISCHGNGVD